MSEQMKQAANALKAAMNGKDSVAWELAREASKWNSMNAHGATVNGIYTTLAVKKLASALRNNH